ncbi:uncharacterized protein ASPGLDRAFT_808138 [Aspergillus glaucus CBS 516.65]|uniref:Uncharacterized protein n=1 Tax=Aspergillus glaucus CBS 516.65 TaxID=1160497 RepID=A0A1L9VAN4_ASPGL|nr:hypothetical protein ASPGLDRAFT_808138 [Aspergillus glaucus CBS 516.65]OJJ80963.1 hypothetical protein ASPGLDRAFT_808138 [Aspergillus glaucus CBS 516.65]
MQYSPSVDSSCRLYQMSQTPGESYSDLDLLLRHQPQINAVDIKLKRGNTVVFPPRPNPTAQPVFPARKSPCGPAWSVGRRQSLGPLASPGPCPASL